MHVCYMKEQNTIGEENTADRASLPQLSIIHAEFAVNAIRLAAAGLLQLDQKLTCSSVSPQLHVSHYVLYLG